MKSFAAAALIGSVSAKHHYSKGYSSGYSKSGLLGSSSGLQGGYYRSGLSYGLGSSLALGSGYGLGGAQLGLAKNGVALRYNGLLNGGAKLGLAS